ncbi:MAG: O-antigen ligase family protein [Planctomycetota bacterium]
MTFAPKISPAIRWFDNAVLCIVLGLTVLRAMVIESPLIDQSQTRLFLSSEIVSLLTSIALLACIGLWFLAVILRGQFCWRKTGFGIAVGAFIIAGILSAVFASDKRSAVTDLATLATPMLAGLLLVQLLTSAAKIRLALFLILSVGIAATVQCVDQQASSNQTLIEDYEANRAEHLQKQGIEPDSMEHWMYEHRLYSKDIRGFLMTSNSTASFFLFAVFAGLGLCLQTLGKKMSQEQIAALVCYILAFGIVLFGLLLTQSKGGIGAFTLGLGLFVIVCLFGKSIWKYRRAFGILVLLLMVLVVGVAVAYGLEHGRLPGGNSMLVRWQYWTSAAAMTRDHIFTGIGGGNFPDFYTHYKVPAASETVQNPHNWVLSLLSQYGPLGLITFLAAVLLPLHKVCRCLNENSQALNESCGSPAPDKSTLWIGLLAASAASLLFVRPLLVDAEFLYQKVDVRSAAYLVLYLFPAGVFILAFVLLRVASIGDVSVHGRNNRLSVALMCGLVAVLIHNLIDFAIFEPGNFGVFWLFVAILAAQIHNTENTPQDTPILDPSKRLGLFAGLALFSILYSAAVLLPPMRAERFLKQAMGDDVRRIKLIETAIAADNFSSKTAYKSALMFKQAYQQQRTNKDPRFLEKAIEFAHTAAARNPADFKPWRLLGRTNMLLAEQADGDKKEKHLQAAFEKLQQAIARYPGSGKLHYDLAAVSEQLKRDDVALCHYQTAVEIEDVYRAQFRIMYPERETVISRLGNAAYNDAKAKIESIQEN